MKTITEHHFSYELILGLLASLIIGVIASLAMSALVMMVPLDEAHTSSGSHRFVQTEQVQVNFNNQRIGARPAVYKSGKQIVLESDT